MKTSWEDQRNAAAWYIRQGRLLLQANSEFSNEISRRDNNSVYGMGERLIQIGRRIAMGYELEQWTPQIYRAHINATRPALSATTQVPMPRKEA